MSNSDNQKLKDLFKQAAEQTNSTSDNVHEAKPFEPANYPVFVPDEHRTLQEKVLDFTESGLTKWDILASKMDGEFSERFMLEMQALSGREFVRTYLKMLEYFRPKIIRVEGKMQEEEDTVIKVEIFNSYEEVQKQQDDGD